MNLSNKKNIQKKNNRKDQKIYKRLSFLKKISKKYYKINLNKNKNNSQIKNKLTINKIDSKNLIIINKLIKQINRIIL